MNNPKIQYVVHPTASAGSGVGVRLGVGVVVRLGVGDAVRVGVAVRVRLGVRVGVKVAVRVGVGVSKALKFPAASYARTTKLPLDAGGPHKSAFGHPRPDSPRRRHDTP